jgi:DNA (cytosine-5)-methyltransferase 1
MDEFITHVIRADGFVVLPLKEPQSKGNAGSLRNRECGASGDPMFTLGTAMQHGVAHSLRADGFDASEDGDGETSNPATLHGMAVRRLTPRECERLQGFPDDYTAITYRRKPAADGPRYRALGNSMAVPVMRWIGERIALADRCTGEGA